MSRWLHRLAIVAMALFGLAGLAVLLFVWWLNPSWTERLAFVNDQIMVRDAGTGDPIEGAVAFCLTGQWNNRAGWGDKGADPPENGERQRPMYSAMLNDLKLIVTTSDAAGRCRVEANEVHCEGRRSISSFGGGRHEHGHMRVLIYKRGYMPELIAPLINQAADSVVALSPMRPMPDPTDLNAIYDAKQSRSTFITHSVSRLKLPFEHSAQLVDAYLTHPMDDGRLIEDWLIDEISWLAQQASFDSHRERIEEVIQAIKTRDPGAIRLVPTQ